MDFYNPVFPGKAKVCVGFMSFHASPAALKQKTYHNAPNMQPIITLFQVLHYVLRLYYFFSAYSLKKAAFLGRRKLRIKIFSVV